MECSKLSLAPFLIACGILASAGRRLYPLSNPLTTVWVRIPREAATRCQGSKGKCQSWTTACVRTHFKLHLQKKQPSCSVFVIVEEQPADHAESPPPAYQVWIVLHAKIIAVPFCKMTGQRELYWPASGWTISGPILALSSPLSWQTDFSWAEMKQLLNKSFLQWWGNISAMRRIGRMYWQTILLTWSAWVNFLENRRILPSGDFSM